jgi:hypothetical protein
MLTASGLGLILESAEILHEGEVCRDAEGTHYFGSTLFSLDVDAIAHHLEDRPDGRAVARLLEHLLVHPFFRVHLVRLARREVLRRVGRLPREPLRAEMRGRVEGRRILVDLDVEFHGLAMEASGRPAP